MTNDGPLAADSIAAAIGGGVATAMLITVDDGRLVWANSVARRLVYEAQVFAADGERLVAATRYDEQLLAAAARLDVGSTLRVRHGEFDVAVERPAPDRQDLFGHMRCSWVWHIGGSPIESIVRRNYLRDECGATEREAAVGDLVAQGMTVSGIAVRLGTRQSTIRTQLKRVLAKSQTHRQPALAALLRRIVPPLRHGERRE